MSYRLRQAGAAAPFAGMAGPRVRCMMGSRIAAPLRGVAGRLGRSRDAIWVVGLQQARKQDWTKPLRGSSV